MYEQPSDKHYAGLLSYWRLPATLAAGGKCEPWAGGGNDYRKAIVAGLITKMDRRSYALSPAGAAEIARQTQAR